jgi:hypothetical protein
MTSTVPAAGSTPAPKNLFARFIGVLIAPKETFQSIVPAPKWFGMLALSAVLVAIFAALPMTTPGGKQAWLDQQVEARRAFGQQTDDRAYAQLEKVQPFLPYITAGTVILVTPIMALIIAGILFAIFNAALGGEASFKQVFSVYIHAGVISVVSMMLSGVVNYFSGRIGSVANLGALLPMLPEKSFVANLLGTVDIFIIWSVIVLAIGLGVLYKRRTQPIAISLLSVYAVIALGWALFKSRGGA